MTSILSRKLIFTLKGTSASEALNKLLQNRNHRRSLVVFPNDIQKQEVQILLTLLWRTGIGYPYLRACPSEIIE